MTAALAGALLTPVSRPESTDYIDDIETGFRCHWKRPADEALCDLVLASAATSHRVQVQDGGWPEPFSDGMRGGGPELDFYMSLDAQWGAYTYSNYEDADPEDARFASASYVVIDPRVEDLHLYVAHEFNHVLQFAVDSTEPSYVPWEAAAVLAEEQTYPGEGSLADYAPDFQKTPWESLLGDGTHLWEAYEIWSYYEYGSALWLEHLRQNWGVEPVDLWWAMINETWQNEPDVWDSYGSVTGDADAALIEFSLMRARIGREDAAPWTAEIDASIRVHTQLSEVGQTGVSPRDIQDLGIAVVDISIEETYALGHALDPDTRWAIVDVETSQQFTVEESIELSGPRRILFVNLGPSNLDVDSNCQNYCAFEERAFAVWTDPPQVKDTGIDDSDAEQLEKAGCACGVPVQTPTVLGAWLVLVGLFWRRR